MKVTIFHHKLVLNNIYYISQIPVQHKYSTILSAPMNIMSFIIEKDNICIFALAKVSCGFSGCGLGRNKVSMLTYTCPQKNWGRLKLQYAITRMTAHFKINVVWHLIGWFASLQKKERSYMTANVHLRLGIIKRHKPRWGLIWVYTQKLVVDGQRSRILLWREFSCWILFLFLVMFMGLHLLALNNIFMCTFFQSSRFLRSSWRRLQSALEPSAGTAYGRLHIGRLSHMLL